ncbi:MAG: carboxypeptidase regulatory-like domain-containing protein [Xanthobacteraceae bacterium]|nr:carboxypeptidase regulatory-like domain-containing protein [Xanthobacteraceae bacterium]
MTKPTLVRLAAAFALTMTAPAALAADALLSGVIKSSAGETMSGVTVSAKADGATITTTVFTDAGGAYYFPPLPPGRYRVWAQALTFDIARAEVALDSNGRQDFTLKPLANFVKQLPGDALLAALPQTTPEDARMHRIVRNNCTGCHSASYVLQHRFDEDGWRKVIATMKNINGAGVDQRAAKRAPNGVLDANENALAAYLARARGPGDSSMNFATLRPRPTGEAARAVFREYDVPVDPEIGDDKTVTGDGSDWTRGTPARRGSIVHDAWMDFDGHLWVNSNAPNRKLTIARVDTRTGAYKPFVVPNRNGFAGNSHGMWRDKDGVIWFNVNTGRGGLAKIDPRTEKIDVYMPPQGMSPTGGATTVDIDGKGFVWVTTDVGALRFDPVNERFAEFKSPTPRLANGTFGRTYGLAADRNGNGWWAQMQTDTIGVGDPASGQSREIRLAPVQAEMDRLTPDERAYYANMVQPDYNTPIPWQQGPRRMGTDKNADVLWVGNSWGGNLARIDTNTGAVSYVPMPDPNSQQPYQIAVDSTHAAWTNMWTTDRVARYSPATGQWTLFDLPSRGTEARYISIDERDGRINVVLPYARTSKIAVLTLRSEADIESLRKQAQR